MSIEIAVLGVGGGPARFLDGDAGKRGRNTVCAQSVLIITGGKIGLVRNHGIVIQGSCRGAVGHLIAPAEAAAGLQVLNDDGDGLVARIQCDFNDLVDGQILCRDLL